MNNKLPKADAQSTGPSLMMAKPGRRCPHCDSDKWVHLESSKVEERRDPISGKEVKVEILARYGCAKCAGEFYVEKALALKGVTDPTKCPHCSSPKILVAIQVAHGAVIICKKCGRLGMLRSPGVEATTVFDEVKASEKPTAEALEFFGRLGLQFEIKQAKARRSNANINPPQPKPNKHIPSGSP